MRKGSVIIREEVGGLPSLILLPADEHWPGSEGGRYIGRGWQERGKEGVDADNRLALRPDQRGVLERKTLPPVGVISLKKRGSLGERGVAKGRRVLQSISFWPMPLRTRQ